MADLTTLARPYARAAFEYARERNALPPWRNFLLHLSELVALAPVRDLITSPAVKRAERAELLGELASEHPPSGGANLLRLMAENDRLQVLPALAAEFMRLAAMAETTAKVVIETAVPLEKAHSERLIEALSRRLDCKIEAHFEVVPEIIGGVVIRADDHVIDGSIATRLRRLARAMVA
ncbi:ATP synthase subunit delta [bacterium BMS3Bbin12]|nr:ATP synthase subunit delta [bacterium BMS3Abin12]GBE47080.1 ATP synthase subunit delta [bacterium BMS3Bbin12]GBE51037.1 ATP synthase subunit delta [bacterium BMS3Bbin13]HDK03400.1 F0F1 ATP synthase subunit delta [Gammaproteobacteria bacterium]